MFHIIKFKKPEQTHWTILVTLDSLSESVRDQMTNEGWERDRRIEAIEAINWRYTPMDPCSRNFVVPMEDLKFDSGLTLRVSTHQFERLMSALGAAEEKDSNYWVIGYTPNLLVLDKKSIDDLKSYSGTR